MAGKLNPELFDALVKAFGKVRVAKAGIPLQGRMVRDWADKKRRQLQAFETGEYYQVCCPFCGDTRFRLWINHRWDTFMDGARLSHLVICYNEDCNKREPDFLRKLRAIVAGQYVATPMRRIEADPDAEVRTLADALGHFIRVDRLPGEHAAVRYLETVRHVRASEAGGRWGISWCGFSTVLPQNNRLFFPLYDSDADGKLVLKGGQAHWLDPKTLKGTPPSDARGEAKWYTLPGTKKSQLLYNGYRARRQTDIVVITEGPFHVISAGADYGVGLWGKNASAAQKELLWNNWGSKGAVAVLALDPDAADERLEMESWFKYLNWEYVILESPPGTDIGDRSSECIWNEINKLLRVVKH